MALPRVEILEGGSASIQNSGDTSYRPARVGERIGLDEAVLPSPRSRMVVRCPNNTRSRVVPGRVSGIGVICPDLGITRRSRGEDDVLLLNSGVFPYEAQVLSESPMLTWPLFLRAEESQVDISSPLEGEVPEAEGFRSLALGVENPLSVPLRKGDISGRSRDRGYWVSFYRLEQDSLEQIWQIETRSNIAAYDGPPLEAGVSYSLIVESTAAAPTATDDLCGEGEAGLDRWRLGHCFRSNLQWLGPERGMALEKELAAIEAGDLENDANFWALVYAYQDAGLHQRVIALMVPSVAGGDQPAAIHTLLANSYLRAGWLDEAQRVFKEAERLATRDGDFQTRLEARLGLVKVAAWQREPEVAVDYLWTALRDASYLEDREQADVILQLIRKLS